MPDAVQSYAVLGFALLCTGGIAGFAAGLLGVGGGIVIVPILFTALTILGTDLGVSMHLAVGTSLATIIPTSVSSLVSHHRKQAVDWRLFGVWTPWIVVGCITGTWIATTKMGGADLAKVFGVIALFVAADLIVRDRRTSDEGGDGSASPAWIYRHTAAPIPFVTGGFSAMMGIGGGTLTVPILNALSYPIHKAVGTSSGFGLLIAVPATIGYVVGGWDAPLRPAGSFGYVSLFGFVCITLTATVAAPIGARTAHSVSPQTLRLVFAGFLFLTSARMLLAG